MAYGLRNEIIKSIDEVTERLIGTNVYGLDRAIFGSSLNEGISELDLLHRIYSLSQKTAVSSFISQNDSVINELTKLRQLSIQAQSDPENSLADEQIDLTEFQKIRSEEFWFSGDDINKVFSPIVCGDVFKLKKREFILLSQPCDTILRQNGKRKTNSAVLIPIKKYVFEDESDFISKYNEYSSQVQSFVFREDSIEQSFWLLMLNLAIPVSLDVLALCTFNSQGKIEFTKKQEISPLLHLDGQINRFNRLEELSQSGEGFPTEICLDTGIYRKEHGIKNLEYSENHGWKSKLLRVRRLDAQYSEHALNKYFAYKSRKAFDHDFTTLN